MDNRAPVRAEIETQIPFHHVDMLNIAWHGHYCQYLEEARCVLLEKIGYDYLTMKNTGYIWPIVDIRLKYLQAARFRQRIRVEAELVEWEYRMKIKYRVHDAETGRILVKAHSIQVAVDAGSGEMCYASPRVFLERLEEFSSRR